MLNKLLTGFFYKLGLIFSYLIPFKLVRLLKALGNSFYSAWIKVYFNKCDGTPYIEYPIIVMGHKYIKIGKDFNTRGRLRLEAWDKYFNQVFNPQIIIGDNVNINFDCHIGAINKIVIGNNVLIGSHVFITDHFHGAAHIKYLDKVPQQRDLTTKGPVIIEDNVWIGEGVAIMPNVIIGKNSIIGANAVVTHNVPSNCYAVGVPAKSYAIPNN